MSLNSVVLQGRIPFDLEIKNEDDEKRAFLGFNLSVRRNYKPEGEEYYPEDLIYCKAFGQTAIFINKYFAKGDNIIIQGEVRRDDDYEDEEGNLRKGQMYVHIIPGGVHFQNGNTNRSSSNESSADGKSKTTALKKKTANKQRLNPLLKKKAVF